MVKQLCKLWPQVEGKNNYHRYFFMKQCLECQHYNNVREYFHYSNSNLTIL